MLKNLLVIQDTWVWSLGWEDSLEESMATSSSILAWRIPMDRGAWWATALRLHRAGHDWTTEHSTAQHSTGPHLCLWRCPLLEFCWPLLVLLQSMWWGVNSTSSFTGDWLYPPRGTLLGDNWSDGLSGSLNANMHFLGRDMSQVPKIFL